MMLILRTIKLVGTIGFFLILMFMYTTPWGIPGIRRYDSGFKLLDMKFHYHPEMILTTFDNIGNAGRNAYRRFQILDFIFLACFFIVMTSITDAVIIAPVLKRAPYFVIVMRALFDGLENIILIYLLNHYPDVNLTLASVCSWATTLKFIMLFAWIFFIIIAALMNLYCHYQP